MDSLHLEGYPGCIGFGYVKEQSLFHPPETGIAVIHPYDELLIFAGTDPENLLELGAQVFISFGTDETCKITQSSVAVIPKGLPHGPIKVEKVERPFLHICLTNGSTYDKEIVPNRASAVASSSHVKTLTTSRSAYETIRKLGNVKMDERGVMDLRAIGPGESYQMVQMHPEDLLGVNISFSVEFCKTPGSWMTTKLAHVHPEPELLLALSLEATHMDDLGASLEFWFGTEREVYVIDKPTLITIPRPWIVHTPLITQKVDRPFMFMLVYPGSYMQAAFVETGFDVT